MAKKNSRRSFIKKLSSSMAGLVAAPMAIANQSSSVKSEYIKYKSNPDGKPFSPNDRVNVALIGAGGMGQGDMETALMIDGIEVVAACDLYKGRLTRAKERWGNDIFTTRDYREVLDRSDVDAIINATTDHWHEKISIEALDQGKHVYCEKPMVKTVEEGHNLIKAQEDTGKVFQVGSQYVSSIIHAKAKELIQAGEIGEINFAEAQIDRQSARGAWQYSISPDASPETVDWETYIKNTPDREWDAKRFFRWRNYRDYGTGIAGDLFVHMLSMLHYITDSSGPDRIFSTGGLRYWEDGRNVPDIHLGLFDYPETDTHPAFNLALRTNLISGGGGNYLFRIVGSEGSISIGWDSVILRRTPMPEAPGMSVGSFSEDMREEYKRQYDQKYDAGPEMEAPEEFVYNTPDEYKGDRYHHFENFFASIREGKPFIEDATFGLRACGPCIAANKSYFDQEIVNWDPESMQFV